MVSSDRLSRFDRELVAVPGGILSGVVETWAFAAIETFLYGDGSPAATTTPTISYQFFSCASGAYFNMMIIYIQVIWKRGLARNRLLASVTISLFILCTAHCILVFAQAAIASSSGLDLQDPFQYALSEPSDRLSAAANIVYVTANILADGIFILRCYAIWNFQKKIIVIPVLLTLGVASGIGYFSTVLYVLYGLDLIPSITLDPEGFFLVTIGVSLFTTFILMGLTVGRIRMLSRTAQRVLGAELTGTYHTVGAMILESGALYLCGGLAFIAATFLGDISFTQQFTGVVLAQLVGIAPTIIAVRVALGKSVENVNSFIVPRPRVRSRFHQDATALDQGDDKVLYIGRESVKMEAV